VELFEQLERRGEIDPETDFIVETTTGNAGAAAAYVAQNLGYDILIFMPENMPKSRIEDVRSYLGESSELRLTEKGAYVSGTVRRLRRFLASHRDGYEGKEVFPMDHSRRSESVEGIRSVTEMLLDEHLQNGTTIDACVLALGNGTTFSGVGEAVRERQQEVELIGVEPAEAPRFYTEKHGEDRLQKEYGIEPTFHQHSLLGTGGWGVEFPNLNVGDLDRVELSFEQEWRCMLDRLHSLGHFVGHTSAACQWVVERQSAVHDLSGKEGSTFFGIFYDPIEKY
jgi:cysteine synthase A